MEIEKWEITSKDPYKEAADIIGKWAWKNGFDSFVVTLELDGEITTELLLLENGTDFFWEHDWWEGQKSITMLGFCPIRQMYYLGEPRKNRRCYYVLTEPQG